MREFEKFDKRGSLLIWYRKHVFRRASSIYPIMLVSATGPQPSLLFFYSTSGTSVECPFSAESYPAIDESEPYQHLHESNR